MTHRMNGNVMDHSESRKDNRVRYNPRTKVLAQNFNRSGIVRFMIS
jgi:hypothetical protein